MYRQFFGLRDRPFDLTANPRFLFLSSGHLEALSLLLYGLTGEKGITLLVGEAGTGKTTLLRAALSRQDPSVMQVLHLTDPTLTRLEFYEFIAYGLGLRPDAAGSKTTFLRELELALAERRKAGLLTALIVDEAQAIPSEILEEIRMLANLETPTTKLLSILLTGQPELAARLNDPGLRALKQRVALRTVLPAFALQETAAYIAKRVRVAGGDPLAVFDRTAIELVHQVSRGIPRTINVICDNALMTALALRQRPVSSTVIMEVCRDLDLDVTSPDSVRVALAAPAVPVPAVAAGFGQQTPPPSDTVPIQLLSLSRPSAVVLRVDSGGRERALGVDASDVSGRTAAALLPAKESV